MWIARLFGEISEKNDEYHNTKKMRQITLENQEQLTIREAIAKDANRIITYVKQVGDETDFLTFSGADFHKEIDEEIAIIEAHQKADNQIFLVADINDNIVGLLNVNANQRPRLRHIGEFGISVRKAHWNKKIGSHILNYMIDWAKANPLIRKINLKVLTNNESAIHVYKKLGFEIEGLIKRDFYLNGEFTDCYWMGLEID